MMLTDIVSLLPVRIDCPWSGHVLCLNLGSFSHIGKMSSVLSFIYCLGILTGDHDFLLVAVGAAFA